MASQGAATVLWVLHALTVRVHAGAEVFVWGRGEYGRLGLGDRSGSSKLRATPVAFREPDTRVVQVLGPPQEMQVPKKPEE